MSPPSAPLHQPPTPPRASPLGPSFSLLPASPHVAPHRPSPLTRPRAATVATSLPRHLATLPIRGACRRAHCCEWTTLGTAGTLPIVSAVAASIARPLNSAWAAVDWALPADMCSLGARSLLGPGCGCAARCRDHGGRCIAWQWQAKGGRYERQVRAMSTPFAADQQALLADPCCCCSSPSLAQVVDAAVHGFAAVHG